MITLLSYSMINRKGLFDDEEEEEEDDDYKEPKTTKTKKTLSIRKYKI